MLSPDFLRSPCQSCAGSPVVGNDTADVGGGKDGGLRCDTAIEEHANEGHGCLDAAVAGLRGQNIDLILIQSQLARELRSSGEELNTFASACFSKRILFRSSFSRFFLYLSPPSK